MRHRGWIRSHRGELLAGATTILFSIVVVAIFGSGLRDWAVALGMDEERGSLVAATLAVGGAAALSAVVFARPGASRVAAIPAMVIVEVIPFIAHARSTGPTPGLAAKVEVSGWILQPLGMVFVGLIAAYVGAGMGMLARRDLGRFWPVVKAHPVRWSVVTLGLTGLGVVASGAASTGLSAGPVSALYTYDVPSVFGDPMPGDARPSNASQSSGLRSIASQATSSHSSTSTSSTSPSGGSPAATPGASGSSPFTPGHLDETQVDGRRVAVYVSGTRAVDRGRASVVVYLLHGYPNNPDEPIKALQVGAVVDQLVASRQLPPTIVVIPDGNGSVTADAEWGDNPNGNAVESWLTRKVVPAIDAKYSTLGAQFRGIAGYSAGGFGAVNLAVRHPELFRWAASWSGYFEARPDIFRSSVRANSPDSTARDLPASKRMPLYLAAGTSESWFLGSTTRFNNELKSLGWPQVQMEEVPGGHSSDAWRIQMVHSFNWLGQLWSAGACEASPVCGSGRHG